MTDGYGSISFWGHSPSLDLQQQTGKQIVGVRFLLMFIK